MRVRLVLLLPSAAIDTISLQPQGLNVNSSLLVNLLFRIAAGILRPYA